MYKRQVITATTEVVISEKSKPEFASDERSGIAFSRISTMRINSRLTGHSISLVKENRSHHASRTGRTVLIEKIADGVEVVRCPRTIADLHRTPQRFQNDRIFSSLTASPRSNCSMPSRIAASSSSSST